MINTYYRTKDGTEVTEDDAFDDEGQLKDGFTMRTKVQVMDGLNITRHQLRDALDERHVVTDRFRDKRDQINRYNKMIGDAWKPKPNQNQDEASVIVAHKPKDMDSVYAAYDARIANAWR